MDTRSSGFLAEMEAEMVLNAARRSTFFGRYSLADSTGWNVSCMWKGRTNISSKGPKHVSSISIDRQQQTLRK